MPIASKLLSNKEKFAMLMWDDGKSVRRTFGPNSKKIRQKLKFIYSEKATKFCEIFTLLLSVDKSKVKISLIFVAFSEYTNFM